MSSELLRNLQTRFRRCRTPKLAGLKSLRLALEPLEQRQLLTVFNQWNFESESLGTYTMTEIQQDFDTVRLDSAQTTIVNDAINGAATKVMRITNTANDTGNGVQFTALLGVDRPELWLNYDWKFDQEFCSTKGGKMPGLYGLDVVYANTVPDYAEGFIAKFMFKQSGTMISYNYDRTDNDPSPRAYDTMVDHYFINGNWYNITERIVMSTFTNGVANADGIEEVWVNGRMVFQFNNLKLAGDEYVWFNSHWEEMKVDGIGIQHFYGGDSTYAPSRASSAYIDNITAYLPDDDPTVGTRNLHNPQATLPTLTTITDRNVVYDNLVTAPGTIQNSSYPNNYELCTDETWLIDAGVGNKATLNVTAGSLASATLFSIFDGNQTDSAILVQKWGTTSPVGTYTSTGRYMFVRLSTDGLYQAKGFTGNVTFSTASTTPAAPSRLLATPNSTNQIDLTWTDNSTNETAFEIDRATNSSFTSGLVTATVAAGVTTYASTGLTAGVTYYYRIRATVGGSTDSANSRIATTATRPNAPTSLTATAVAMNQINLTWTDASTNETSFLIDRATNSAFTGASLTTFAAAPNTTSYQSTGLTQNTTYYYRVRSSVGSINGANTNTAIATTATGFTSTFYSVAAEDGYITETNETSGAGTSANSTAINDGIRAGDTSSKQQLRSILSFDTSSLPDNATIVSATIRLKYSTPVGYYTTVKDSANNNYTTGGQSAQTWGGQFRADIKGGTGFNDSTTLENGDFSAAADATGVAQLWGNFDSTGLWTSASLTAGLEYVGTTGKTQFRIYFQNDDNNDITANYLAICSGNAANGSRPELIIEYTVGPVAPTTPTALVATAVSTSQINLTWTDASNTETGFEIDQATDSAFSAGLTTATVAANAASYQATGLAPNTTYYYRVRATIDGTTDSANSNTASAAISAVDVRWNGATSNVWAAGVGDWKNSFDGSPANYIDGVGAVFDDTATGLTADISTNDVTPTSVTFNNTNKSFTVTGSKGIAGATTTVTKTGAGTVILSSANTYGGVTAMDEGTIILQGAAMNPVLNGGGADILGGMLMFDYAGGSSPAATVRSLLAQSFHAGAFDTGKFQSSAATPQLGLGWIDNTSSSKISVVYTIYGDANLDGTTDFSDLGKLLAHYNQPGVWADGDFNYDGMVDFSDLGKMLANYNKSRDSILLQVAGDNIVSQAAALVQESATTVSAASSATTTATVDAASSAIDDIAAPVASHRPAHSGLAAASSKARDRYVFSRAAAVAKAFADTELSSNFGEDDATDTVAKATAATTYAWRHNARSAFAAGPRR